MPPEAEESYFFDFLTPVLRPNATTPAPLLLFLLREVGVGHRYHQDLVPHRREEELARALEQQRELFAVDVAVEVRAFDAVLDLLHRRVLRDVAIEAVERFLEPRAEKG